MNNWNELFDIIEQIKSNISKDNGAQYCESLVNVEIPNCINGLDELTDAYSDLKDKFDEFVAENEPENLNAFRDSLESFEKLCKEKRQEQEMGSSRSEYDRKKERLNAVLSDLDDICDRAVKNSLYSQWHIDLLEEAKTLVEELNDLAQKEGREAVSIDFSKYAFNPNELRIDGIAKAYADYEQLKTMYDGEILPNYYEILQKYVAGQISEEEYNKYATVTSKYNIMLKEERIRLMENIRTAVTDDYIERPQHEVNEFLEELHSYNEQLREYNKLYKELEVLRNSNGDRSQIEELYQRLSSMATELQGKRPALVERRGLIYNPQTLKDLTAQKNMLEDILRDAANSNDQKFEEVREQYENRVKELDELMKSIVRFRNSISVGKIKPLDPVKEIGKTLQKTKKFYLPIYSEGESYSVDDEIKRLFGPDAKVEDYDIKEVGRDDGYVEYEATKKEKQIEARRGTFYMPIYSEGESYSVDDEIKRLFGPDAKVEDFDITEIGRDDTYVEYEAVEKSKKKTGGQKRKTDPTPKDKDYDFESIEEPGFIVSNDERVIPKVQKYNNLEELLRDIIYGKQADDTIEFSRFDNFVYKNKNVKLWNFPKSHGITIADKPMKLVKSSISFVASGICKIAAKFGYKNDEVRKRIDGLLERINQLTNEEIEFLFYNLTGNKMTELSGMIPEVAMTALNDRLIAYYTGKINSVNQEIETYFNELIDKYTRYEQATDEKEKANLDAELCQIIIKIQEKQQFSNDLNKGGTLSFMENWSARHNSSFGGRNIGRLFNPNAGKTYSFTHIADYVNSGRGYLAARDFIYGEKVKINGTQTKHKAANWFHKTRTGAFEFKPFVEVIDYSKDTYLQDIFSTLAIVANVANMMYIKNLQTQLAEAQRQIDAYKTVIDVNNQQIALLTQQKQLLESQLAIVNQQITQNNQLITELQDIAKLYNTDPDLFVKKLTEFMQIENGKTHGFTEYSMMEADSVSRNSTSLMSSGSIYRQFDQPAHIFSKDIRDQILRIAGDGSKTASEKASELTQIMGKINDNLSTSLPNYENLVLDILKVPGNSKWSFDAFLESVSLIGTYDSTFVPNVFSSFVEAASKINDLNIINTVTGLNIPSLAELPTLMVTIPQASMAAAIVSLSTLIGKEATEAVIAEYNRNPKKVEKFSWADRAEALAEKIKGVPMDLEAEAKRIYEEKLKEFNSKSPWYRLTHRKEKRDLEELAYAEARRNAGYEEPAQGRGI